MKANKKFLFGSPPVRLKTNPRHKAGGYGKTRWPSDPAPLKNKPPAQGRGLRENSLAE